MMQARRAMHHVSQNKFTQPAVGFFHFWYISPDYVIYFFALNRTSVLYSETYVCVGQASHLKFYDPHNIREPTKKFTGSDVSH